MNTYYMYDINNKYMGCVKAHDYGLFGDNYRLVDEKQNVVGLIRNVHRVNVENCSD